MKTSVTFSGHKYPIVYPRDSSNGNVDVLPRELTDDDFTATDFPSLFRDAVQL